MSDLPELNLPVYKIEYDIQNRDWATHLARQTLIARSAQYISSDLYFHSTDNTPGPYDGDEMDLRSDQVDEAAARLVELLKESK